MGDRMKSLVKRSGSKLQMSKGSMKHMGTTPYKFKIDIFISYVDPITNATKVCVTWERRGKTHATNVVNVRDGKAVFQESLQLESTLFRKACKEKDKKADAQQLKFDEKKVKLVLRKDTPEGKSVGKITLNIAEYVRGTNSTVFADMKLSNGSVVVSKIEATMLHMGKKSKTGSAVGSEAYSEVSDSASLDNDSIFDDDESTMDDSEVPSTYTPPQKNAANEASKSTGMMSPVSFASSSTDTSSGVKEEDATNGSPSRPSQSKLSDRPVQEEQDDEGIKQSPSLRHKLKNKLKEAKTSKKDKEKGKNQDSKDQVTQPKPAKPTKPAKPGAFEAETRELRHLVESLKEENMKLRKGKHAAMEEIDALRSDLEACENALEEATANDEESKSRKSSIGADGSSKNKDKVISELRAQNQGLVEELEQYSEGGGVSSNNPDKTKQSETIKALKGRIQNLEIALEREPHFLEVVNELKVTKVTLAMANMEKEQALFAMQTLKQELGVQDSD